jgi:hypothetical protein
LGASLPPISAETVAECKPAASGHVPRRDSDTDIVARRISEIAETLTELLTRAESRT